MNLKDYIGDVKQLEQDKYAMECIIRKMDSTMNLLGRERIIYRRANKVNHEDTQYNATRVGIIITAIIWFFIGISLAADIFWLFLIMFLIPSGLTILFIVGWVKGNQNDHDNDEEAIEREYRQNKENDNYRIIQENKKKEKYLAARNKLYDTYENTCNILKRLYSKDVIYEKYRYDFVAICMFWEYFQSGRCTELTGHEGAYNIYESEIRMGVIISKLDEIIKRLDRIENNQYAIYSSLQEISRQQNRIISNLNTIVNNQGKQMEQAEYLQYSVDVLRTNSDIAMIYGLYN